MVQFNRLPVDVMCSSRALVVLSAVCLALSAGPRADTAASRRDADVFKEKIAKIAEVGALPTRQPYRTVVTESEVNAYLVYEVGGALPAGVVDPAVGILGTGRLTGRAVVDLDAVSKQKRRRGLLDPMSFLSGRVPVTATGTLKTSNGAGRFELESATLAGVPVPKVVLQEILSFYSATPENPAGVSLDDPFELPARIREIQVEQGRAVVVQ